MPMTSSVDFAILAPVPEEHLESGLPVCEESGFVAYGSQKWELFREADRLRAGQPVPALIYPSDQDVPDGPLYVMEWIGWYVGHVHSSGGAHPDRMEHRPESTLKYLPDNSGFWAIFWHVAEWRRLPEAEWRAISSICSYSTGEHWQEGHPPRGPEIVARPSWI